MNLVDKQDVSGLQVGKNRCQITRARDGGPGGCLDLRTELICDNGRERCLAEPRRAREDHMVKALAAILRRLDQNAQALLDMPLPAIVVEALRS